MSHPAQPEPAQPHFVGRVQAESDGSLRFAWSGTCLSTCFEGSELAVELADAGQNLFAVIVDGQLLPEKFAPGPGRRMHRLVHGLPPGEHQLTLHRLTEALFGETRFFAFHARGGQLLPYGVPAATGPRRIEVIGDSITAGYGNEAARADVPFSAQQENHYTSYAALCARALAAELVTVAWSGKGVFSNYGSKVDTVTMPTLWRRTLPERADSHWDVARFRPHAVVLSLGTNDFSPNNLNQAPFAQSYLRFVEELRHSYPEAFILCCNGPLLSDAWPEGQRTLSRAREAMQDAVEARLAAGDRRIDYLEFPHVQPGEGHGSDFHPSASTHRRMAEQLALALQLALGW